MNRRNLLKYLALLGLGIPAAGVGTIALARTQNRYYSGPVSDHFDGTHFFNPEGIPPKGFIDLIKWQLGGGRKVWPREFPSPHNDLPPASVAEGSLRVSYVGHATVLIQVDGLNLLTDPVWSERCSPVQWAGPKRVNAPGVEFEKLPKIDVVLLSHNHYDHLDLNTLSDLQHRDDPLIVTPLGNDAILKAHDPSFRIETGDWSDIVSLSDDVRVAFEPMHHWSARGMGDRRHALWAAFVIQGPSGNIYHIGDTGFHGGSNYRAIREKYGSLRLAILPFGAFEPRDFMKGQHQNPDEAVQGHKLCGAEFTLGHHWGTFQLTNESIEDQLQELKAARVKHDMAEDEFRALRPGQAWDVPVRRHLEA